MPHFHLFIVISTVYHPPLHRWPRICINTIMLLPLNLRMRINHCQPQHFPRPHTESAGKTWRVCKNKVHNNLKGFVSREAPPLQTASSPSPRCSGGALGWLIRGLPRERNGSLANGCNDRVREEGGVRL